MSLAIIAFVFFFVGMLLGTIVKEEWRLAVMVILTVINILLLVRAWSS